MRALQLIDTNQLAICEVPRPKIDQGEVLVKITAASLNRRDQWIREGKYPNITLHTTLGSDGCGVVVELGKDVNSEWQDKSVLINPNVQWGPNPKVQAPDYQVLGMPTAGTLAEYIAVPEHRLIAKPQHLSDEQAAALPLAGLTAFRAVFYQGMLQPQQKVLITGIGGGVSQMAFLWAQAHGAEVSVTSGSTEKIKKMLQSGAVSGFDYKQDQWAREAAAQGVTYDLIIDSTGGPQLNDLLKLVCPGGRLVFYGATTGLPPKVDLYRIFWNQVTLQGSTMGNDQEFTDMISFVNKHQLVPMVDSVRLFEKVVEALDRMKASKQFGKIVVSLT